MVYGEEGISVFKDLVNNQLGLIVAGRCSVPGSPLSFLTAVTKSLRRPSGCIVGNSGFQVFGRDSCGWVLEGGYLLGVAEIGFIGPGGSFSALWFAVCLGIGCVFHVSFDGFLGVNYGDWIVGGVLVGVA